MAIRWLPLLWPLAACAVAPAATPDALMRDSLAMSRASLRAIQGEAPIAAATPVRTPPVAHAMPALLPVAPAMPRRPGAGAPASAAALLDSTAEGVRAMLGEPALRRPEGPAEIWLYEAPQCRLDVILYADGAGPLRVAHAAARAAGLAPQTEAECLRDIAGSRTTLPRA